MAPEVAVEPAGAGRGLVWTVEDGGLNRRRVVLGKRTLEASSRSATVFRRGLWSQDDPVPAITGSCGANSDGRAMNLAIRDIRHNLGRFLLTCVGVSLLLSVVMSMIGIYRGLVVEALTIARAPAPHLWVVEANSRGPFAETSRIPGDVRELALRIRRMNLEVVLRVTAQSIIVA